MEESKTFTERVHDQSGVLESGRKLGGVVWQLVANCEAPKGVTSIGERELGEMKKGTASGDREPTVVEGSVPHTSAPDLEEGKGVIAGLRMQRLAVSGNENPGDNGRKQGKAAVTGGSSGLVRLVWHREVETDRGARNWVGIGLRVGKPHHHQQGQRGQVVDQRQHQGRQGAQGARTPWLRHG